MSRIPLPDASVDHVLAAFVYHEVESQETLLAEIARVLRRGGKLTVIDFQKRLEADGPPIWVRKSPAHVKRTASRWFSQISGNGTKGYYQLMFSKN
jgi:ubiquinone/menaquinone biosynthesis C-methylase UbiE